MDDHDEFVQKSTGKIIGSPNGENDVPYPARYVSQMTGAQASALSFPDEAELTVAIPEGFPALDDEFVKKSTGKTIGSPNGENVVPSPHVSGITGAQASAKITDPDRWDPEQFIAIG